MDVVRSFRRRLCTAVVLLGSAAPAMAADPILFVAGEWLGAASGVLALLTAMLGWFSPGSGVGQAVGFTETALLIFGVLGLPVAIVVGISYALWAGLCAAFIAFEARPAVKDRLGLMPKG